MSFPCGSVVKHLLANAGDMGSILGFGLSPGGGSGNPLQYSCLQNPWTEEPGPWGCKVSDVAEQLSLKCYKQILSGPSVENSTDKNFPMAKRL